MSNKLARTIDEFMKQAGTAKAIDAATPQPESPTSLLVVDAEKWAVIGVDVFAGSTKTTAHIPAAVYEVNISDRYGIIFSKRRPITDKLIRFPDSQGDYVLESIVAFWNAKPQFVKRGQVFKRGVLMWGPAGSGKTCITAQLMQDVIDRGGIVIYTKYGPEVLASALQLVRKIEQNKPIVCVVEDIDEVINRHGEHSLLAMLDGEDQIDCVVHVATTNFPERLGARLLARPSRFDEIVKVDMPSPQARRIYFTNQFTSGELADLDLNRWVKDTEGMSLAMCRELVVAIYCLDRNYQDTIERLRALSKQPQSEPEFTKASSVGFAK